MKIIIVDDDAQDTLQLAGLLKQYAQDRFVSARLSAYHSGEQFLQEANLNEIDILFLDIYMTGLTGIEVAREARARGADFPIVFLTTSQSHAIESYEIRAFDYILKPIEYTRLSRVMQLLQSSLRDRFIIVKQGREPIKVVLSEIIFVDHHNHYLQIHTKNSVIKTYRKFSDFEQEMLLHERFLTCQRCVMVNMDQIERIEKNNFVMRNGTYVPINRNQTKTIKARYFDYIFGEMEHSADE